MQKLIQMFLNSGCSLDDIYCQIFVGPSKSLLATNNVFEGNIFYIPFLDQLFTELPCHRASPFLGVN